MNDFVIYSTELVIFTLFELKEWKVRVSYIYLLFGVHLTYLQAIEHEDIACNDMTDQ
jgi:hypothetical protein